MKRIWYTYNNDGTVTESFCNRDSCNNKEKECTYKHCNDSSIKITDWVNYVKRNSLNPIGDYV